MYMIEGDRSELVMRLLLVRQLALQHSELTQSMQVQQ